MTITNDNELKALKRIGSVVARCLQAMLAHARIGMSTRELDAFGEAFLTREGARSAPRLVYDFPGATCISINEEIAHGIPGDRLMEAGDVVNVDVSAEMDGFFSDTGATLQLPPIDPKITKLCETTRNALDRALEAVRAERRFNEVGRILQAQADRNGYGVIKNLGGHGIGHGLHEAPEFIAGYNDPNDHRRFALGAVITIEPFFSTGPSTWAREGDDGWTLLNKPGRRSAQYEHTMVITEGAPLLLTVP
jgi:methionyl aminopeptidase